MRKDARYWCGLLLLALSLPGAGGVKQAPALVLAENGKTAYRIVIAQNAPPATLYGARELGDFLSRITGASFPVVDDRTTCQAKEILLGRSKRHTALAIKVDFPALGPEGYVLRTIGDRLLIAGGEPRGTLYGVYGLLEDHLGCRWFTPTVSQIPNLPTLGLPALKEQRVPVFSYRHLASHDSTNLAWCVRNRLNGNQLLGAVHGGGRLYGKHLLCHTFHILVPPATYFATHPEFYSLVGSKRVGKEGHLCCTNPEVIRICTDGIMQAIEQDPEREIFSLSIMDRAQNWCECANCQALATSEGTQMAPVLHLVNRVAATVAASHPEKMIETLAYHFTRQAPRTMKPHPNVIIDLAPIDGCWAHPWRNCTHPNVALFRRDLKAWSSLTKNLWVWDYCTNFAHYLLPFPNHRHRQDNLKFLKEQGVSGVFEQDVSNSPHSEFAQLDAYLGAKALWDPSLDQDKLIGEFLRAYYGKAAAPIGAYLESLDQVTRARSMHMSLWAKPSTNFFTDDSLLKWNLFWERALRRTSGDPQTLLRVKRSRMSLDYAILERARYNKSTNRKSISLEFLAALRFQPFFETLETSGLTHLTELTPLNLPIYRQELARTLGL